MESAPPTIAERIFNFGDPLGATLVEFLILTVIIFGFGALMMGRALADSWRPLWQNIFYGLLLGVANRLLHNFLLGNDVLNLPAYVVQTAVLICIALFAYRATVVHKVVTQYPWLYQRAGLFRWRELS
jgi:hypothetical protein